MLQTFVFNKLSLKTNDKNMNVQKETESWKMFGCFTMSADVNDVTIGL
jgi:hypothetical protein